MTPNGHFTAYDSPIMGWTVRFYASGGVAGVLVAKFGQDKAGAAALAATLNGCLTNPT